MKLSGRDATRFCETPDLACLGALIHGSDAAQVAEARTALIAKILGDNPDPMRVEERQSADLRRDPAQLDSLMKERGFFPGRRIVVIHAGADALSKPVGSVMQSTTTDDAFLIVTADVLPARSTLRKLFEGAGNLASLHLFANAPEHREIEALLTQSGISCGFDHDAIDMLREQAEQMDYGSFRQLIETVALCHLGRSESLDAVTVLKLVPGDVDTEIDALIGAVAAGQPDRIGVIAGRLKTAGSAPVSIMIALQRHFRQLLAAKSAKGGAEAGLDRIRPPLWRTQRSAMRQQLSRWTLPRLEAANRLLFETDSRIRSSSRAPDMALLERCALRLAMMARG